MKRLISLFLVVFALLEGTNPSFAQGELWGVNAAGGVDGYGLIYKTAVDGTALQSTYDFHSPYSGKYGGDLVEVNGKFYGF
jgi:hypothetical protein